MPYGLYISAEGAQALTARMEVIANHLANVDTVGFKREMSRFQARYSEETARGLDVPGSGSMNDLGGGVQVLSTELELSQGPLRETDLPTDLAIRGDGFFVVRRDDQDLLTRAGNFLLSAPDGGLVTSEGYPVLDVAGDPVRVDPDGGPWQVTPEGGVVQDGEITYLALVQPNSAGDLARAGENLFAPLAPPRAFALEERGSRVAPGFLEMSAVQPTTEMMDMIETSRAFEANVNMIRNQDQLMGSLIGRVLRA